MQLISNFYYALNDSQTNELAGIIANAGQSCIKQILIQQIENDFKVSKLQVMLELNNKTHSLASAIELAFRTVTTYNFHHNSLNFNLTELPFQTYESYLSIKDVDLYFHRRDDKSIVNFEKKVQDFLNYHPDRKIKASIKLAFESIVEGQDFNEEAWMDAINTMELSKPDLSRFWNHMLFLRAWMENEPKAKEFMKHYLESLNHNAKLDELRRG